MRACAPLLLGVVLVLLAAESVYDAPRAADHASDAETRPQTHDFSPADVHRNGETKKMENYESQATAAAAYYHNKRQRRRKRSAEQKARSPRRHRLRHRGPRARVVLLNETAPTSEGRKAKARYRILADGRTQIDRRKRFSYVTKDGVVRYVPCTGWGRYGPFKCVQCQCTRETCVRPCVGPQTFPGGEPSLPGSFAPLKPPEVHKPLSVRTTTFKPPPPRIYSGVGKYWIGPRLGEGFIHTKSNSS